MKIGINASFLRKQNTGIGQVSANFLKKLFETKTDNLEFVLYLEEDFDFNFPIPTNFKKSIFLPIWKRDDLIRKILWEMFSLPRQIKKDECDLLLSLYQNPTVLCRNGNINHLMVVHDIIPKLFPQYLNNWRKKLYQWLTERAIRKVDKIISVSHKTEKDLVQKLKIDPKKISVINIDADEIYKAEICESKKKSVLKKYKLSEGYIYTGGGLEMRKNTESVLRAYKILLEAYGKASWLPKLVVSGKLMPELSPLIFDVEAAIKGLGIEEETVVLGYVEQEDLPVIYASAKVFIYPSLYEGFGLPVLEAMSQGTPVITSKTSSLPEVGSDSVLYCDPNDVDDLAMVMRNLLMNEKLQAALSLKGKERSTHFSWEKFVSKILNIINESNRL